MPYPRFDRRRLKLLPLAERVHDLTLADVLPGDAAPPPDFDDPQLARIAGRILAARREGRPVLLMIGAHVLRRGVSRVLIDWMERGWVTLVAMNGAGPIHDFEFALVGGTTERVAEYIRDGRFGLWEETGRINDIVSEGAANGLGMGEAIGRAIHEGPEFPHKNVSVLAAGYRLGVPVTVHVGIGYDIVHEHPNCDGAAFGAASYADFLVFAQQVLDLEGGVLLCFGSAVMGPEVYLKALAMARNVARQEGRRIARFTTAVFDLVPLGDEWDREAPKSDPRYYYRPFKTILVRTVQDGGESFYVQGDHRATVLRLHQHLRENGVDDLG
jgi:hypothetical protein